jgi:hypothetical protein
MLRYYMVGQTLGDAGTSSCRRVRLADDMCRKSKEPGAPRSVLCFGDGCLPRWGTRERLVAAGLISRLFGEQNSVISACQRGFNTDAQTYSMLNNTRLDDLIACLSFSAKGEEEVSTRGQITTAGRFEHSHSDKPCNKPSHGSRLLASHHTTRPLDLQHNCKRRVLGISVSQEQKSKKPFLEKTPSECLDLRIPGSGHWRRGSGHALNRTRRNSESFITVIYRV